MRDQTIDPARAWKDHRRTCEHCDLSRPGCDEGDVLYARHLEQRPPSTGGEWQKKWIGPMTTGKWLLFAAAGLVALVVTCSALAVVTIDTATETARNTRIQTCHYDETVNMSIIIEGTAGNSRSRSVRGNACD